MSFLKEYDQAPVGNRFALVRRWMRENTLDFFDEVRAARPVFATDGPTLVTRFEDVLEVLLHPTIFTMDLLKPKMGTFMMALDETPVNQRDKSVMLAMLNQEDGPRIRSLVAGFMQRALASLKGRLDVVGDVSRKVPIQLVGEHFGFPGPDEASMKRWSRTAQLDSFFNLPYDELPNAEAVHQDRIQASQEMAQYLIQLVQERVADLPQNPNRDDILTRLLKTKFPPSIGFGPEQLLRNVGGLLIGAVETTSMAVAHVIDQLLERPPHMTKAIQAAREGQDDALAEFSWEAMRFKPFLAYLPRLCVEDYTLAAGTPRGRAIPAGTTVLACTQAAMFDPNQMFRPREFRVDRPGFNYLHFGIGHHRCLGVEVARVMIPEMVKHLILLKGLRRVAGPQGQIDYQGGPFPERLVLEFNVA